MEQTQVYVTVLHDSLQKKVILLQEIVTLTEKQKELLGQEELDSNQFNQILEEKEGLINQLLELDRGFESLYRKVDEELQENRQKYRTQILEMQNYIRTLTEMQVRIEALEQENNGKFTQYLAEQKKEIREGRANNRTANAYYQNMTNQHQGWQSYFVDSKK